MKWLALRMIRLYQRTLSVVMPPSCRFVPSCSHYGYEAIEKYGVLKGGLMAGWLASPGDGFPNWGPEYDFNVQCDTRAAEIVIGAARVTFVTLPVAMHAQLRARDLDRLRNSGAIGAFLPVHEKGTAHGSRRSRRPHESIACEHAPQASGGC